MAGNNDLKEMMNAARSFEDVDEWQVCVRDRDGGFDKAVYQDEGYARKMYAVAKAQVEDADSDVVFVRLIHKHNPGKIPRWDDEGGAWKAKAAELCRMESRFMAGRRNEAVFAAEGREIPESKWGTVLSEAVLEVWDADGHGGAIQYGLWGKRPIVVEYTIPEGFEERMNEAEAKGEGDAFLRSLVTAVRFEEDE